jgi:hypothetical protein
MMRLHHQNLGLNTELSQTLLTRLIEQVMPLSARRR